MPVDSTPTKTRIIEAAFREFAAYGLAGARVDRIAESAKANKRAIYEYFGNKEQLFDITLVAQVAKGVEQVPPRWDDLPEYAGLIYDYFCADPDRMRIHLWRRLERPEPLDGETRAFATMITDMAAGQAGQTEWQPVDLFALVWALHFTWFLASPALPVHANRRATAKSIAKARRAVIVEAVRRIVAETDPARSSPEAGTQATSVPPSTTDTTPVT